PAAGAHGKTGQPYRLTGDGRRGLDVVALPAEVEPADDRLPSEVHPEGDRLVPPGAGRQVHRVDVHRGGDLVVAAVAVVAVVADPGVLAPVPRADPLRCQHLVQAALVGDGRALAPAARADVLVRAVHPGVPAVRAQPPDLPQRAGHRADLQPG